MSRAFVKEDEGFEPKPRFDLPPTDAPHYDEAAAWALVQGAHAGHTRSAELATGYRWGEARLARYVEEILSQALAQGDERLIQLAKRYLRAAEQKEPP
jgi:hypothetical protein